MNRRLGDILFYIIGIAVLILIGIFLVAGFVYVFTKSFLAYILGVSALLLLSIPLFIGMTAYFLKMAITYTIFAFSREPLGEPLIVIDPMRGLVQDEGGSLWRICKIGTGGFVNECVPMEDLAYCSRGEKIWVLRDNSFISAIRICGRAKIFSSPWTFLLLFSFIDAVLIIIMLAFLETVLGYPPIHRIFESNYSRTIVELLFVFIWILGFLLDRFIGSASPRAEYKIEKYAES